jgi:hypothetical protein
MGWLPTECFLAPLPFRSKFRSALRLQCILCRAVGERFHYSTVGEKVKAFSSKSLGCFDGWAATPSCRHLLRSPLCLATEGSPEAQQSGERGMPSDCCPAAALAQAKRTERFLHEGT